LFPGPLASLPYQNVFLAALYNALGLDVDVALFDTVISFQKPNTQAAESSASDVGFTIEGGVDPSRGKFYMTTTLII
jgi:hypothetical protein